MESIGAVVMKFILSKKIFKKLSASGTEFFAKGYEKCKIASAVLEINVKN